MEPTRFLSPQVLTVSKSRRATSATPLSQLAARLTGKGPFAAFVRSVGALSMVRLAGGLALELRGLVGANLLQYASAQTPLVIASAELGLSVRVR